jgi:hypothetical protein
MRKKYGKDGLVAVSVSLDDAKDKEARGRVIAFLEKVNAADVINLNLDEPTEVWQTKFKTVAPPTLFVFDRENRIAHKEPADGKEVDHAAVEKKVQELLKK